MTLIEFLRARLEEEELAALGARAVSPQAVDIACEHPELPRLWLRFGPARVLREVVAKRRLVEMHAVADAPQGAGNSCGPTRCGRCHELHPCITLRLLAVPYADHPEYDGRWQVQGDR